MKDTFVTTLAKSQHNYVIEQYHYLHQYPEKGLFEYETAKHIRQELDAMGIRWIPTTETGTIGILEGNGKCDKILALRADIDALELEELTDCEFRSKIPGMMHGCGHDTHVAMLLGAAKALQELGQEKRDGTIYLLFQPGEETTEGAHRVVLDGKLDGISAMYGQHVWAGMDVGTVMSRAGHFMAGSRAYTIKIQGKGGHGSDLSACIDPGLPASMISVALQSIVNNNVRALDTVSLVVGQVSSGSRQNIVPENAVIQGNIRFLDRKYDDIVCQRIREVAENIGKAFRVEVEVIFSAIVPPLDNDETLYQFMRQSAVDVVGAENYNDVEPILGSEDFSEYSVLCPTVFAFVGVRNEEKGYVAGQHSPYFRADEDGLDIGVAMHVQFALNYFAAQQP